MKLWFTSTLLFAVAGLLYACQPDFKMFQQANIARPCTQCKEILTDKSCTSDLHNSTFDCTTPTIEYGLTLSTLPCARATIVCAGKPGVVQSSAVVAQLKSNSSTPVFGAISTLQSPNAHLVLKCNSESQWAFQDLDGNELATPFKIQCAHNQPDAIANALTL